MTISISGGSNTHKDKHLVSVTNVKKIESIYLYLFLYLNHDMSSRADMLFMYYAVTLTKTIVLTVGRKKVYLRKKIQVW